MLIVEATVNNEQRAIKCRRAVFCPPKGGFRCPKTSGTRCEDVTAEDWACCIEERPRLGFISVGELMDRSERLLRKPDAYSGGQWKFQKKTPTWLQLKPGTGFEENAWELTTSEEDNTLYCIKVDPNAKSVCRVLAHLEEKEWVDEEKLFCAMLPAIRAVAWKNKD